MDIVYHGDNLTNGYVFDSIKLAKKHAPWIHKIFILYDDTKVVNKPIVQKHPGYNWIPISSFLPKKYMHSINNSCIVESWLWKCKSISDKFIYMCDDMFIGRTVKPTDFFVNSKPVIRIDPGPPDHGHNNHIPYVQMMVNAITKHNIHYTRISHNAQPYQKSLMEKYYKQYKTVVDKASMENKERAGAKDFNVLRLSSCLSIMDGSAYMETAINDFFCESNEHAAIKSLTKLKPKFFCVNNLTTKNKPLDLVIKKYNM